MVTIEALTQKLKEYLPQLNERRIHEAFEFAREAHEGQKRYSGEPYIIHPLMTAYYLADFHPDEDTIVAALLHDVSEDTPRTLEEIESRFGKNIAFLVSCMEKVGRVRAYGDETQVENLQKMFFSMAKDFRVILIKLCDRLHNIHTLEHVPQEKRFRIAKETLDIYAPIASALGIYRLKIALEDNAFRHVYPKDAAAIEQELKSTEREREAYIAEAKRSLTDLLHGEGIDGDVDGRIKSLYSIYLKMQRKKKTSLAEIFDIFAMRIILPDVWKQEKEHVGHIYAALGVIHSRYMPLAHRFKDYIAIPKVNGYRSLHTTVMGLGPKTHTNPTEIQIRSRQMHEEAEFGIASHWFYEATRGKSAQIPHSEAIQKRMEWISRLSNLRESTQNNDEYVQNLEIDVFQDRIFVLTPRGHVKDLPRSATPVDFAYAVHSEIGDHCVMAKANGNIVPLNYELQNGEVVEIITRQNANPSHHWLTFVKTQHAKNRIRTFFKDQNTSHYIKIGKELTNEYLVKIGKPLLTPDLNVLKNYNGKRMTHAEREALLSEVGKGTLLASALVKKLFSFEEIVEGLAKYSPRPLRKERLKEKGQTEDKKRLFIGGQENLPHRYAKCCKPTEYDDLLGMVMRSGIVSIHKSQCRVFRNVDIKRLQPVSFTRPSDLAYQVHIILDVEDRIGLIRDIGNIMAKLSISIFDVVSKRDRRGKIIQFIVSVEIRNYEELDKILQAMESVPNVGKACLLPETS